MQVKPCLKDNTKIHYFDDNFEYHADIKLNQQSFDELKTLFTIYGFRVIFRCKGVMILPSILVHQIDNLKSRPLLHITIVDNKYSLNIYYDKHFTHVFNSIYEVYSYLDSINIPRNVLWQNKLTHNV